MRKYRMFLVVCLLAGLGMATRGLGQYGGTAKAPMSNDAKIKNALAAAPAGIAKDAAVADMAPGGGMVELRKGANGWTCMPDMANSPGADPMCLDKIAMQWAEAWMAHKDPKLAGMGLGYMLQGGSTADNDDPFAAKPKPGKDWLKEPPHVMVFGVKFVPGVYTTQPTMTQPWIMFQGTPYEHLMIPVK